LLEVREIEAALLGPEGEVSWYLPGDPSEPFAGAVACRKDRIYLEAGRGNDGDGVRLEYVTQSADEGGDLAWTTVTVGDPARYSATGCGPVSQSLYACARDLPQEPSSTLVRIDAQNVVPLTGPGRAGDRCGALRTGPGGDTDLVAVLLLPEASGEGPRLQLVQGDGPTLWETGIASVSLVHDFTVMGPEQVVVLGASAGSGRPLVAGAAPTGVSWTFEPPEGETLSAMLRLTDTTVAIRSRLESGQGRVRGFTGAGEGVFDLLFDEPVVAWAAEAGVFLVALSGGIHVLDSNGSVLGVWDVPSWSMDTNEPPGVVGVSELGGAGFGLLAAAGMSTMFWQLDLTGSPGWLEATGDGDVLLLSPSVAGDAVLLVMDTEDPSHGAGPALRTFLALVP